MRSYWVLSAAAVFFSVLFGESWSSAVKTCMSSNGSRLPWVSPVSPFFNERLIGCGRWESVVVFDGDWVAVAEKEEEEEWTAAAVGGRVVVMIGMELSLYSSKARWDRVRLIWSTISGTLDQTRWRRFL